MAIWIAADIFGITPDLHRLASRLPWHSILLSPYDEPESSPINEQEAYRRFLERGGVEAYAARIESLIEGEGNRVIGFSAGAAALWICASRAQPGRIERAILFYGSRIREHRDLKPNCSAHLIFAEHEPSLDPYELVSHLKQAGVRAKIEPGSRHGFMNERSPGYSARLQNKYIDFMRRELGARKRS